jgi:hypothetical protein
VTRMRAELGKLQLSSQHVSSYCTSLNLGFFFFMVKGGLEYTKSTLGLLLIYASLISFILHIFMM